MSFLSTFADGLYIFSYQSFTIIFANQLLKHLIITLADFILIVELSVTGPTIKVLKISTPKCF